MQIAALFIKILLGAFFITILMLAIDNTEKLSGQECISIQYLCYLIMLLVFLYIKTKLIY